MSDHKEPYVNNFWDRYFRMSEAEQIELLEKDIVPLMRSLFSSSVDKKTSTYSVAVYLRSYFEDIEYRDRGDCE